MNESSRYVSITAKGFEKRLKNLGYSFYSFCGHEVNGVKIRSRSTYKRALYSGKMTKETYRNLVEAIGPNDAEYLLFGMGDRDPITTPTKLELVNEAVGKLTKNAELLKKNKKNINLKRIVKASADSVNDFCKLTGVSKKKFIKMLSKELNV